jgi:succinate dehydrogenase/fumarate reductase flavoprotein subunit
MQSVQDIKQTFLSTDLLIIGGGIGGLSAAVTAKEQNPDIDVLLIEKQTAGYSGKANKGGGVLQYFGDRNPMEFVAYHANAVGGFLGDQHLLLQYVSSNRMMIDKLTEWGVKIPQNDDGSYKVIPTGPMVGMIGVDLDITLQIRRTAEKKGVAIIDKVAISDILTKDGKAIGATGYSIIDGTFYIIQAKAVVLATGSQNYRIMGMWSSARGDGIAAAYRAGAELRNPEFGGFAQLVRVQDHEAVVFGENVMYNAKGENITKNFRLFPESDINSNALVEWYRQMNRGNGPVHLNIDEYEVTRDDAILFGTDLIWKRPYGLKFWKAGLEKAKSVVTNHEVAPGFTGEQSPVKVGHDMQTTISGLFAIGDTSYAGSNAPGAVPAPPGRNRGSGILFALFSAMIAGKSSVLTVESNDLEEIPSNLIQTCSNRAFAPLWKEQGISSKEVIEDVKEIIAPVETSVYMSEHRIETALRKLMKAKEKLPMMKAQDYHDLLSCHEAEAMVLCAELFFRASLLRKESRGWFYREDYPQLDNQNWMKWIVVKNVDGEMVFGTEDVPIQTYPIKPHN